MGVSGLWDIIRPVGQPRSLTHLAVVDGFERNHQGRRGLRIGIDASIWFFHATYGKEGENPELRTLFFRCARLLGTPFLPLFVFDGPKRPEVKRGKRINKEQHWMVNGMKNIIHAFGFASYTAPGEAEAELAYLNSIGEIDAVLSDDSDTFLFGATMVIRNPSNSLSGNRGHPVLNAEGKDDGNHVMVYRASDVAEHEDLGITRGGFILIGLLSGGDYHPGGLPGCGPKLALGLARAGLGDSLLKATQTLAAEEMPAFLDQWRNDLRTELKTNSSGFLGRKCVALSKSVPEDFPDLKILHSYTNPITTESEALRKGTRPKIINWGQEPNIGKIAGICELYFEWGVKDIIIKRFRTVLWQSAVLRILRKVVLDLDRSGDRSPKVVLAEEEITSSSLLVKIHSSRRHAATGKLLEYRLEIAPAQLVTLAADGVKGTRPPPEVDSAYAITEDEDDEEGGARRGKKTPPEPTSHLRIWLPACMIEGACPDLVRAFEGKEAEKEAKKASKGKGRAGSAVPSSPRKRKPKAFPMRGSQAPAPASSSDEAEKPPSQPARSWSKPPSRRTTPAPPSSQTSRVASLFANGSSDLRPKTPIREEEEESSDGAAEAPTSRVLQPSKAVNGPSTPTRAFTRTHSSPAVLPSPPRPTRAKPAPFPTMPSPVSRVRAPNPDSDFDDSLPVKTTMPSFFGAQKSRATANTSKRMLAGVPPTATTSSSSSTRDQSAKSTKPSYIELSDSDADEPRHPAVLQRATSKPPPLHKTTSAPAARSRPAPTASVQRTISDFLEKPAAPVPCDPFAMDFSDADTRASYLSGTARLKESSRRVGHAVATKESSLDAARPPSRRSSSPRDSPMRSPSCSPRRTTATDDATRLSFSPPPLLKPTKPRESGASSIISISSDEEEIPPLLRAKLNVARQLALEKQMNAPQRKLDQWATAKKVTTRTDAGKKAANNGGKSKAKTRMPVNDVIDLT